MIVAEPELQELISHHSTEERLKRAWTAHWRELTAGKIDDAYIHRRLQIGQTHERVGLRQHWYLGAYVWVFDELLRAIQGRYDADPDMFMRAVDAAFRLVVFDMQTGVEAYIQGVLRQRDDREEALVRMQTEAQARADEAHTVRRRMVDSAAPLAAVAEELTTQVEGMRTGVQRLASAAESITADRTQAALSQIHKLTRATSEAVTFASEKAHEVMEASTRARTAVADAVSEFLGITTVTDQSLREFQTITHDLNHLVEVVDEVARASDVVATQATGLAGRSD